MKLYGFTEENKFKEYIPIDFQVKNREALLEEWLENNPEDIIENGDLLIIGRQVSTNLGGFMDLSSHYPLIDKYIHVLPGLRFVNSDIIDRG
jgi:hypothetical protein